MNTWFRFLAGRTATATQAGPAAAAAAGANAAPSGPADNAARRPPAAPHASVVRFEQAAEQWFADRQPHRAKLIVRLAAAFTVAALAWAAWAQLDEITRGDGRVVPSRQRQVLQSLDGGVITAILAREGQVVEKGQLLMTLDRTRVDAGLRESTSLGQSLAARIARLRALAEGSEFIAPASAGAESAALLDEERRLFEARRDELRARLDVSRQQSEQRRQDLAEARARGVAAQRALEFAQQELSRHRPLLALGGISELEIMRMERDAARARAELDQAEAQASRSQAAIDEAQRRYRETELGFRNDARRELAEALGRLDSLQEGAPALADKVARTQLTSPVRGRVHRVLINTVGGVVQPGKDVVEIVPLEGSLELETRVPPRDIAFVHQGQKAVVKLSAYDFSVYGGLEARVDNISPDTVVDERGQAYYVVRVVTTQAALAEDKPVLPGMTAEVNILTGRKSVLAYLLKPVLKAKDEALRER